MCYYDPGGGGKPCPLEGINAPTVTGSNGFNREARPMNCKHITDTLTGEDAELHDTAHRWMAEGTVVKAAHTQSMLLLKFTENAAEWAETAFAAYCAEMKRDGSWKDLGPAKRAAWMYAVTAVIGRFCTEGGIGISDPNDHHPRSRHVLCHR